MRELPPAAQRAVETSRSGRRTAGLGVAILLVSTFVLSPLASFQVSRSLGLMTLGLGVVFGGGLIGLGAFVYRIGYRQFGRSLW